MDRHPESPFGSGQQPVGLVGEFNSSLEPGTFLLLGAGGKLGAPLASAIVASGASVVVADTFATTGPIAHGFQHPRCSSVYVDVRSNDSIRSVLAPLSATLAGVVYLPRLKLRTSWGRTSLEDLLDDFAVSAAGFVLLSQALTGILDFDRGVRQVSVVAFSSVLARHVSRAEGISYHLAKAALEHAVRFAAVELGQLCIRVNAVAPGWVDSTASNALALPPEMRAALQSAQAMPNLATHADVINSTLFLLSKASRGITGQILATDGGLGLREPMHSALMAIREFEAK